MAPVSRLGVHRKYTGKPDQVLAEATDVAYESVLSLTAADTIGAHQGAVREGDRLVCHFFECQLSGYPGWQWFSVLGRASRAKVVTVNEVGLLPTQEALVPGECASANTPG